MSPTFGMLEASFLVWENAGPLVPRTLASNNAAASRPVDLICMLNSPHGSMQTAYSAMAFAVKSYCHSVPCRAPFTLLRPGAKQYISTRSSFASTAKTEAHEPRHAERYFLLCR